MGDKYYKKPPFKQPKTIFYMGDKYYKKPPQSLNIFNLPDI